MPESIRFLLSVAVASLDVKTAFLYDLIPITQFVYMRRPTGLTVADMPATLREHSDASLRSFGFTPTVSDPGLYVHLIEDGTKAYIAVHVDDFGIASSNKALKEENMAAIKSGHSRVEGDLGT